MPLDKNNNKYRPPATENTRLTERSRNIYAVAAEHGVCMADAAFAVDNGRWPGFHTKVEFHPEDNSVTVWDPTPDALPT